MSLFVFTTFLHLLTIPFSPSPYYTVLITSSTSISALWHYTELPATSTLAVLHYLFTILWFIADMGYPVEDTVYVEIMTLNISSGILNPLFLVLDYSTGYSIWNILNVFKSIYIANLLSTKSSDNLL
jgi:hypothetical protein